MIHHLAEIDTQVVIPESTVVWALAQIRSGARVGEYCMIGRGAYIGPGVRLGNRTRIQNGAYIYEPAILEDGVFVGPGAILTNDRRPRAVLPDGTTKGPEDWLPVGVHVGQGAAIGAGAICVAPVSIGSWALVGAGAVVTQDVPGHALVIGNPARLVGWVGKGGEALASVDGGWISPVTGERYRLHETRGMITD